MIIFCFRFSTSVIFDNLSKKYTFLNGALLERLIFFHGEKKELFSKIKNSLMNDCLLYDGPHFSNMDNVFISSDGATFYLLLSGREIMLYALDAGAYDTHRKQLRDKATPLR